MDELAEKMGMDPLELRYLNVYRPGATTPTGQAPEVYSFPQMIDMLRPKYEAALEKARAGVDARRSRRASASRWGIYGCGLDGPDASEVWVELTQNGVTVGDSWEDHGQGADMGSSGHRPRGPAAPRHRAGPDQTGHERHGPDAEERPRRRQPAAGHHRQCHSQRLSDADQPP